MRKRILFVGTYFSHRKGSKSVAEKLVELMREEYVIELCSGIENKALRMLDILWRVFFFRGNMIVIDVYSGPAFLIAQLAMMVAKKIRKKPVVLVLRGGKLAEYYEGQRERIKSVFLLADKVATPSLYLKGYFEQQGFEPEYLPNFVILDRFQPTGAPRTPFSLLWVRSFRHIYNPELAILTLKSLLGQYPQATLTMIGPDGGMLEACKNLIAETGLSDKIRLIGPVANDQLAAYYSAHAVYLNTTSYESFGMAVMEAAACEIPLVSTAVGEIPFLWEHEKDAMLVGDFSAENMAAAVSFLLSHPAKAREMAVNAAKKAHSLSWPVVQKKWENIFQTR